MIGPTPQQDYGKDLADELLDDARGNQGVNHRLQPRPEVAGRSERYLDRRDRFPKATGRMLREGLGKVHFWLWFIGTNLTFLPMFWLGFHGMPRRIPTYLPSDGFTTENLISSIGAALLGLGAMVFMLNVAESLGRPRFADPDPWEGHTLEWATSCPPPRHNFTSIPRIRSERPAFDLNHPEAAEYPVAAASHETAVLNCHDLFAAGHVHDEFSGHRTGFCLDCGYRIDCCSREHVPGLASGQERRVCLAVLHRIG